MSEDSSHKEVYQKLEEMVRSAIVHGKPWEMETEEAFDRIMDRVRESYRLRWWLKHIARMRDRPSVDLREAAYRCLEGNAAGEPHND